jgi:hypothetical protein
MMIRFIASALAMLPLLGGISTEAAPTVSLIDQTDQGEVQPVYWVRNGWGHGWHHDQYWWPRDHYWWHYDRWDCY